MPRRFVLTQEQERELETELNRLSPVTIGNPNYPLVQRILIIRALSSPISNTLHKTTGTQCGIPKSTLYHYRALYMKGGIRALLQLNRQNPYPSALKPAIQDELHQKLAAGDFDGKQKASKVHQWLISAHGVRLPSVKAVYYWLNKFGVKSYRIAPEANFDQEFEKMACRISRFTNRVFKWNSTPATRGCLIPIRHMGSMYLLKFHYALSYAELMKHLLGNPVLKKRFWLDKFVPTYSTLRYVTFTRFNQRRLMKYEEKTQNITKSQDEMLTLWDRVLRKGDSYFPPPRKYRHHHRHSK